MSVGINVTVVINVRVGINVRVRVVRVRVVRVRMTKPSMKNVDLQQGLTKYIVKWWACMGQQKLMVGM
jgi:hypothetical protein